LLDAIKTLDRWPERVRLMQENWIGRSEGARVVFDIAGGIGAILVVFLWSWWFPELRLAKSFESPDLRPAPLEETKA